MTLGFGLLMSQTALAADLAVTVDVKGAADGTIMIALYDSADTFRKTPVTGQSQPAAAGPNQFRFADLKPGEYGIALYLDRNRNGKLDTNLVGMPTEPYAFSREPKGRFAPPSWDDVKFSLPAAGSNMTIHLGD